MNGLEAPNATSTSQPVSAATELAPNAIETGVRTPIGRGPTRNPKPGTPSTDRGGQSKRIECRHLADPQPVQARGTGRLGDLERLQVRPVQPQWEYRFDGRPHSVAASVA